MKNQNHNKTVIVVGAGASADFVARNPDEILAEIISNSGSKPGNSLITKPKRESENNIAMPVGEDLVEKIENFKNEITELFLFKYLDEFYSEEFDSNDTIKNNKLFYSSDHNSAQPSNEQIRKILQCYLYMDRESKNELTDIDKYSQDFVARIVTALIDREISHPTQQVSTDVLKKLIQKFTSQFNRKNKKDFLKNKISDYFSNTLKPYLTLCELINYYDPISIDNMLSHIRKGHILIANERGSGRRKMEDDEKIALVQAGKNLITYYLLKAENKNIFNYENKIWYRWLRNTVINSGTNQDEIKGKLKDLTIISFNYDRSLLFYIKEKMPEFADVFKPNEKIIYPYGYLSLKEKEDDKNLEYGELREILEGLKLPDKIEQSAQKINDLFFDGGLEKIAEKMLVIGEKDEQGNDKAKNNFELANKKLSEVKHKSCKVYYLGFGFLEENCKQLFKTRDGKNISGEMRGAKIYYTNFGDSQKIKKIFNQIYIDGDENNPPITRSKFSSTKGVYDAIAKDFDFSF